MAVGTYTLRRGDNIWSLANGNYGADYRAAIPGNTTNVKVDYLINLNNIADTRKMPVGYVVYLNEAAKNGTSSSTAASTPAQSTSNKVNITTFGLQSESTTGRDLFASWTWHKLSDHTEKFEVRWEWDYNGETKFQTVDTTDTWAEFTIPEEFRKTANWAQVFIIPIAETQKDSEGKDIGPYWTAEMTGKQYHFSNNPPIKPDSAPTVTINKETLMLTAKYENIVASDLDAYGVAFNVVQDNSVSLGVSNPVPINTVSNTVQFQFPVTPGHTYTVRARTTNQANTLASGWSDFSGPEGTQPSAPSGVTVRRDTHIDENNTNIKTYSVFLTWSTVPNATDYTVEYTNVRSNFDTAGANVSTSKTEDNTSSIRIGINSDDLGYVYYFRVRANNEDGTSDPSEIVELPIGVPPGPPSTWSTSNSAFVGETMELNWIHNPTDNSKQTFAQIAFNINDGGWQELEAMVNSTDVNDTDPVEKTYAYGTAVSYKGDLYFKMDTNHLDLKNAKIQWKVRTSGVDNTLDVNSWSVERTIYIYEKPTLGLTMTSDMAGTGASIDTLTSFPFYIRGILSLSAEAYKVQRPVGYHVQIISNDYYVTVDDVGRAKTINPGDAVYSTYFNTSVNPLVVEMSANNIDLESGINYTIYCTADMSSGLAVHIPNGYDFTVNWVDVEYAINADISVDTNAYTALITPYCREKIPVPGGKNLFHFTSAETGDISGIAYSVEPKSSVITFNGTATKNSNRTITHNITLKKGTYTASVVGLNTVVDGDYDRVYVYDVENSTVIVNYIMDAKPRTFTIDKDTIINLCYIVGSGSTYQNSEVYFQLELGSEATKYEEYYETYEDGALVENVTLAVYRREYDGSYTKIASDIPNNYTAVTDPHPALDYARYRFAATDTRTGALSFWDMAGYPVNGSAIIIQWAEEWSTFDGGESTAIEGISWSGSLLKLPYNIKVTDKRNTEVSLVNYAGRKHPVGYYGTQVNETSQWSVEIPKDDKDTVYALRRLSLWSGDAYVREPSGMGYWANVVVSFNQSYDDVKIPVTLDITRVEGGV